MLWIFVEDDETWQLWPGLKLALCKVCKFICNFSSRPQLNNTGDIRTNWIASEKKEKNMAKNTHISSSLTWTWILWDVWRDFQIDSQSSNQNKKKDKRPETFTKNTFVLFPRWYPPGNDHISPEKVHFEDDFPFPQVGYVNFQGAIFWGFPFFHIEPKLPGFSNSQSPTNIDWKPDNNFHNT